MRHCHKTGKEAKAFGAKASCVLKIEENSIHVQFRGGSVQKKICNNLAYATFVRFIFGLSEGGEQGEGIKFALTLKDFELASL
jgi:hypothetical protein